MLILSKAESIVISSTLIFLGFLLYQLGGIQVRLEKPKENVIYVDSEYQKNLTLSEQSSFVHVDFNTETILYVSSDVRGKDDETLNRIGVRMVGLKNDKNKFYVEICDSVNKKCFQSEYVDRSIKPQRSGFLGE